VAALLCTETEEADGIVCKAQKDLPTKRQSARGEVIEMINPALRGWVNYFRIGDSHRCFSMVKYWVEKKIRRHLMRARGRKGMGWKQWSKEWIYGTLGLFNDYRVGRQSLPKSAPASYVT
jgi:RNA-directed DNA polymerase